MLVKQPGSAWEDLQQQQVGEPPCCHMYTRSRKRGICRRPRLGLVGALRRRLRYGNEKATLRESVASCDLIRSSVLMNERRDVGRMKERIDVMRGAVHTINDVRRSAKIRCPEGLAATKGIKK